MFTHNMEEERGGGHDDELFCDAELVIQCPGLPGRYFPVNKEQ